MFRNYLVTALRNIARHKLYSFINIAGLAVGLACAIFIMLFVRDELSYDTWLPDTQHIYRVEKIARPLGRDQLNLAIAPFMLPTTMRDSLPEVTAMTRIFYAPMSMFAGDRQFRENVASVAPNFFTVIRFPLAKGDPATVFRNPESAVVSESAALKYFGTTDAIGKTIKTTANCDVSDKACLGRLIPLKVTGVMRDIPHNSQLDGDVFVPSTSITDRLFQQTRQSWYGNCCYSYVVLAPGVTPQAVVAKMAPILDRIVPSEPGDSRKGSQRYAIHLTPFTDVHLTAGRWSSSETPAGSWPALYGMGAIGFLILLIACFNFMNLSTARALLRAREIGLRKTHGARRGQLVAQFLGEAVLMALLSLILAAILRPLAAASGRTALCRRLAFFADDRRRCRPSRLGKRTLPCPRFVGLSSRDSHARGHRWAGRFGPAADHPGRPAVRRIHRAGRSRHRHVRPDQFCAKDRSGFSQGQYSGHCRKRSSDGWRTGKLRPAPAVRSRYPGCGDD